MTVEQIRIADETLRLASGADGRALTFREKTELARRLDRLGVSVIELGPIENEKIDSLLIKSVSALVKEAAVCVTLLPGQDPAAACKALGEAVHPRLQVECPVSPVQMEYLLHKKPAAVLEAVKATVAAARAFTADVELLARDATRGEGAFVAELLHAAVEAGASAVTVCDTAGVLLPEDVPGYVENLYEQVPELKGATLGFCGSDALSMATACALAAARSGVRELKTVTFGGGTASLQVLCRILAERGEKLGLGTGVRTVELQHTLEKIESSLTAGRSRRSPFDDGVRAPESDGSFSLTIHDNITAVLEAARRLGYELSEEDGARVFEAFSRIASKKEAVSSRELDAIVASAALQVPPTYRIQSYVINTGNIITATCHMRLLKGEQVLESVSVGDGAVDAAFLSIEQIMGRHYELDDFQISAVTEGREAMGETIVKLRSNGKLYSGRGISTDVVGSSIRAYINALNKIVYEEEAQ